MLRYYALFTALFSLTWILAQALAMLIVRIMATPGELGRLFPAAQAGGGAGSVIYFLLGGAFLIFVFPAIIGYVSAYCILEKAEKSRPHRRQEITIILSLILGALLLFVFLRNIEAVKSLYNWPV